VLKLYQPRKKLESDRLRKQTFDKIKKTLAILLAVFFVITLTAASASACGTKKAEIAPVTQPASVDANGMTEEQKTKLGKQLLDYADKNMFGNAGAGMGALGGLFGDNWNTNWLGNDFGNNLGGGNDWGNGLGNDGYGNSCNQCGN
jgi:hypothetical protein